MTDTPRTDALITRVMAEHPRFSVSGQAAYYEAVHQELAPLARTLECETVLLREQLKQHALTALASEGQWIEMTGRLTAERDEALKVLREIAALDYSNAATNFCAYTAVMAARALIERMK